MSGTPGIASDPFGDELDGLDDALAAADAALADAMAAADEVLAELDGRAAGSSPAPETAAAQPTVSTSMGSSRVRTPKGEFEDLLVIGPERATAKRVRPTVTVARSAPPAAPAAQVHTAPQAAPAPQVHAAPQAAPAPQVHAAPPAAPAAQVHAAPPAAPAPRRTPVAPAEDAAVVELHPHAIRPWARLSVGMVTIDEGYGQLREVERPLIELGFDYPEHGTRVRASDPELRFFAATREGMRRWSRNVPSESRARRTLEGFGALDLEAFEDIAVAPGVRADYLVNFDGDLHEVVAFSAYAVPQLRRLGWQIEFAPGYPYTVLDDAKIYADLSADEERPDWFALELGVETNGKRVSLLPAIMDLLDESDEQTSLSAALGFGSFSKGSTKRCFALPVGDTHVAIPGEQMKALVRVVLELYDGSEKREQLSFRRDEAASLVPLDEAFAGSNLEIEWEGEDEVRELAARFVEAQSSPKDGPSTLQATLRPYQRVGLGFLQHLRAHDVGGILADDMGLGKTLQTIAHIATEKAEGRLQDPALVVAPTSLTANWAREIEKFAPHLRVVGYHGPKRAERLPEVPGADVVITSYPVMTRDHELFAPYHFHLLILDEAHTIKNVRSQSHQAVKKLDAEHRLCITGTPVENHLGELWALFDFLNPGLLGSEAGFRAWYRNPIEKGGDESRLEALHEKVAPFLLRRLKSEVATELPPKTQILRAVELRGKQRELYESIRIAAHAKVRDTIRRKGLAASRLPILDALMKLRQLCCDPGLVKLDAARFVRESAKAELFYSLTQQQLEEGHRILVFSQFTSMLEILGQGLTERGIGHLTLTGASKDRQGLCDRFESGEADVFLLSLKAAGTGLNLVSADTVIHYDPWWNPQAQAQATDRAYRIGQKKPVFVYDLFVAGSVEERMIQLQRKKRHLADAILHGELPQAGDLTEADVEILFSPLK